jgi:hypothetical protein
VVALVQTDAGLLALVALGLATMAVLVTTGLMLRQQRLLKRYKMLLNGSVGTDLETMLLSQESTIREATTRLMAVEDQLQTLKEKTQSHLQKAALVRFNAFPDTGSDLSFALALLDANRDGVIVSSLYGRTESRIYAKPVRNGVSTYALSDEEKEAMAKALA